MDIEELFDEQIFPQNEIAYDFDCANQYLELDEYDLDFADTSDDKTILD